jgi:hypothetical protein
MPTGSDFPHGVSFPQNEDATPEPSSERISRSYRVSSFRGLPQSASPPTRNCLDFGWRNRHFQKAVRWRGPTVMGRRARPRTAGGPKLIAAANHDLAAVVLTLRRLVGGAPPGTIPQIASGDLECPMQCYFTREGHIAAVEDPERPLGPRRDREAQSFFRSIVRANKYSRFSALNPVERGGNSRAKQWSSSRRWCRAGSIELF